MQPFKTEAIKRFLESRTHKDLANLYTHDMEVQVNVGQDGGTFVEGDYEGKRWRAWTDGVQTWKPFRIPRNANTTPVYEDHPLNYDLAEHAEGIGMTGWDWKNRLSRWVAFDFDAITGHSTRHSKKLTADDLKAVRESVWNIPWTTLRLSTSGKGLHLYVFLKPVSTENHTEHASLARAILHMLSGMTGFDFDSKVDVCGGNMWVWHRKMNGTPGLTLEKQGIELDRIPANWRDHVAVISNRTQRALPKFIEESDIEADIFAELTGQRNKVKLDSVHKDMLQWFTDRQALWWWDNDHHMLVTHTHHLKEAHEHFGFRGQFETVASGSNRGHDHNCFAFPLPSGAWAVRRYTPGTQESPTWTQDGKGWTRCYLNREIDLATSARIQSAVELPSGGWAFKSANDARQALQKLGAEIQLPDWVQHRPTKVKAHPKEDGKVVVSIPEETSDPKDLDGWYKEKKHWNRIYVINTVRISEPDISIDSDGLVRHLVNPDGVDAGWIVKSDGRWNHEPIQHVQHALASVGLGAKESKEMLGSLIFKPWKLMNVPFAPEYPGDRRWNRDAAQLKFPPSTDDAPTAPTWEKILNHIGQGLDEVIRDHDWCRTNGIARGAEYLKCWISSMFKEPTEPLPYLFLWGDQNCGKSILHEALCLLLTRGYNMVDNALVNQSGFNGEMENTVLCIVEEINLSKNVIAYNRIKDWVTSKQISIHRKGKTPYLATNTTHFIQCANDTSFCPIFPGDTRITMIEVKPLTAEQLIPKKQMLIQLEKEAPDFLAQVMRLELPLSNDRLNIPVVRTPEKERAEEANETELDTFIRECCHYVPGSVITVGDMWDRFREWLDPSSVANWTKIKMGRSMPNRFPKGTLSNSSTFHYGNISFEQCDPKKRLVVVKGILRETEGDLNI